MEKIVFVILAVILVASGIFFLLFLNSERKLNISRYWKAKKINSLLDEKTRKEFQKNELKIKSFKQLLEIVLSFRNNAQKGLNELKNILGHHAKKTNINEDDLEILKKIDADIQIMKNKLIRFTSDKNDILSDDIKTTMEILMKKMNIYTLCLRNILEASDSMLKNTEFFSHEVQTMESNYKDIIEIHTRLIRLFHDNFTEPDA
ncbi:MAG: hypothetical protein JXB24_03690 [Bacteroidales bacterium]|nr:hypothetical protein [Bacteroidales bacterium]